MAALLRHLGIALLALMVSGCGTPLTLPPGYVAEHDLKVVEPAPPELLRTFESGLNRAYLLGPGDVVEIVSPVHPEIAGEQTISPEGQMTVYPDGGLEVAGLTRAEAEKRLKGVMARYYNPPAMTLRIKSFENNQVLVLGKVTTPGVVKFKSRPNLLEALARSGAFPAGSQDRRISHCDIIRGKDQILRVAIDELLKGGSNSRNLDLANNDIIYIPENEVSNVYVMGEVAKPGAYEIRTSMTLLNAIMMAGGPGENAVTSEILLVRDHGKETPPVKINLEQMVDSADYAGNLVLAKNDIVFIPRRGLATFNYYLRMINPFTTLVFFGTTATKN